MIERFLRYSLENQKKIQAVFLEDGKITRRQMLVTGIDEAAQTFSFRFAGRKREAQLPMDALLTADYARGDHGDLE